MRHNAPWVAAVAVLGLAATPAARGQGSSRGLVVAPENRCAPYNSDDYGYSQTLERAAIAAMGGGGGGSMDPTPAGPSPGRRTPTSSISCREARRTIPGYVRRMMPQSGHSPMTC